MRKTTSLLGSSAGTPDLATARQAIRNGVWTGSTRAFALGQVQCGIVVLPKAQAYDFLVYCGRNPKALPVLEVTEAGSPVAPMFAATADIRTDVPKYHVYRNGTLAEELTDISSHWQDDFVTFLLGCSLTFDLAMLQNELPYRQLEETGKPTMYVTDRDCRPAGLFRGRVVVSMRPMLPELAVRAVQVTSRFPWTHGAPIHIGDPQMIGIDDVSRPDIGVPVTIRPGETPVFWACIATIWETVKASKPPLMITHAPGCMFITDRKDESVSVF